jgi:hypothetical protein
VLASLSSPLGRFMRSTCRQEGKEAQAQAQAQVQAQGHQRVRTVSASGSAEGEETQSREAEERPPGSSAGGMHAGMDMLNMHATAQQAWSGVAE